MKPDRPSKGLSRTLIRVDRVVEGSVYVVIPGWHPTKKVRLKLKELPLSLQERVCAGKRFHARVNVGAYRLTDLRIFDYEDD